MKIPKLAAIIGFNICSSVFIGLSAYGIMLYMGGDPAEGLSPKLTLLAGLAVAGSIAGIGFFGTQWDRRKHEEARRAAPPAPAPPKYRKKHRRRSP